MLALLKKKSARVNIMYMADDDARKNRSLRLTGYSAVRRVNIKKICGDREKNASLIR
jgi:hypothetical protein